MNDVNHFFESDNRSIRDRHTPFQLALARQTMRDFWTQYALDNLMVSLLFIHWASLLFLLALVPPFILPSLMVR